jgi:hypothetical protein
MTSILALLNTAFGIILATVERMGGSVGRLMDFVIKNAKPMSVAFADALGTIAMLFDGILAILQGFATWFIKEWPTMQPVITAMAKSFETGFLTMRDVASLVIGLLVPMLDYLKNHMLALQIMAGILGVVLGAPLIILAALIVAILGLAVVIQFVGEKIAAFVRMAIPAIGSFFNMLGSGVHAGIAAIQNFVGTVLGAITGFFGRLLATVEAGWAQFASRPVYWIAYLVVYVNVMLAHLLANFFTWVAQMVVSADNWVNQMTARAQSAGMKFLSAFGQFMASLPGRVLSWLGSVISQLPGFSAQMGAHGAQAGTNFFSNLARILAGMPGQVFSMAVSIGRSIAQGVASGITSSAGAIAGAARQAVAGAIAGAKSAAGIASPAQVFADQIGKPIAQGVALGIRQSAGLAHSAMANMMAGMTGNAVVGYSTVGTGGAGRAGGGDTGQSQSHFQRMLEVLDKIESQEELSNKLLKQLADPSSAGSTSTLLAQLVALVSKGQYMRNRGVRAAGI